MMEKPIIGSSKFKGVHWSKRRNHWIAQIKLNKKGRYIGSFKKEKEAALAYDQMALELFKDFAYLNFK